MKKIIVAILMLLSISMYSQEYKVKAIQSGGMTVKYDAILKITDSLFSVTQMVKGVNKESSYDIVNTRNGVTYVTDGVMTHYFTMTENKSKKKGKQITHELYFTMDANQYGGIIVYYMEEI